MKVLPLLAVMLITTYESLCCSCIPLGKIDDKQFESYDLIIIGRIEKIEENEWTRIIYIKIKEQYKGQAESEVVSISSPSKEGMCGIFPKVGQKWLMFAYKKENGYSTNLCTRTKSLNRWEWDYNREEIEDDLEYLKNRLNKK